MSMTTLDGMKAKVASMLKGVDRYNPQNIPTLEDYVNLQAREYGYDLEANLALLKLYQFKPNDFNLNVVCQILLKALTNLPNSDFVICKCMLSQQILKIPEIEKIQVSNLAMNSLFGMDD